MGRPDTHTHVGLERRAGPGPSWWSVLDALVLVCAVTAGALLGEYLVREMRARRTIAQAEDELRAAASIPVHEVRVQRPAAVDETASPASDEPASE